MTSAGGRVLLLTAPPKRRYHFGMNARTVRAIWGAVWGVVGLASIALGLTMVFWACEEGHSASRVWAWKQPDHLTRFTQWSMFYDAAAVVSGVVSGFLLITCGLSILHRESLRRTD